VSGPAFAGKDEASDLMGGATVKKGKTNVQNGNRQIRPELLC